MALVRLFIPAFRDNNNEIYFNGFISVSSDSALTIYLTKFGFKAEIVTENPRSKSNTIHGFCGDGVPKEFSRSSNYILLNKEKTRLSKLVIDGQLKPTNNTIIMYYEYDKIRDSQTITESADISKLQELIHEQNGLTQNKMSYTPSITIPYWLTSSMFLQHICNYLNLVNWLMSTIKKERKISIRQGNLILAVLIDILLGYVLLQMLPENTGDIRAYLMEALEKLINMLYSLLTWLMGAPVGLKLNNAFNKMLGKYFSYHVQLWWLFLDTCSTKLDIILNVYHYIGYLGFTFQIAVISDTMCVATFHSYCIYVYAARLFNIQISGLIALLRLFVGRKYNPLRGGIDSCEYTNQELFVGTVAFTILLLLLPTTTMYYIVFTVVLSSHAHILYRILRIHLSNSCDIRHYVCCQIPLILYLCVCCKFRVLSLTIQHALAKLIYIVQTLPMYVATLWLTRSNKVAGNIFIQVENTEESPLSSLVVRVDLISKSIFDLVRQFKPPVEVPQHVEWTNLLSNVLIGKQIV